MSAMASALRRKDFAQAEKLAQPDAKPRAGAQEAANQQRFTNAAKDLQQRGQEAPSWALQQMAQGMKQGAGVERKEGRRRMAAQGDGVSAGSQ